MTKSKIVEILKEYYVPKRIKQDQCNWDIYFGPIATDLLALHEAEIKKRDAIIEALEGIVKLQASYGKIGDIMELRKRIETLKSEIK